MYDHFTVEPSKNPTSLIKEKDIKKFLQDGLKKSSNFISEMKLLKNYADYYQYL